MLPSVKTLRELLDYEAETGLFRWKNSRRGRVKVGGIAGTSDRSGYQQIRINGKKYMSHRVAWAMSYGAWPTDVIDHINMDKADNRLANLRSATKSQNRYNLDAYKNNTSGHKGVSHNRKSGLWRAYISYDGARRFIGDYAAQADAVAARLDAEARYHGVFARMKF